MNGFNLDEAGLLKQFAQTKQLEIERLLRQYGNLPSDVRQLAPQLLETIGQQRLATQPQTEPMIFSAAQAAEMGLGIQEGWSIKLIPENGGYKSSFITPQNWEITEDALYISPEGKEYSEADIQALLSMPEGLFPEGGFGLAPITLESLTAEGQEVYKEYQTAGGELHVEDWLQLREREQLETEQIFGAVFPEQDIQEVIDYMTANPEQFLADIREIGATPDMVAFLKQIPFEDEQGNVHYLTDTEVKEFFGLHLLEPIRKFQEEFYARLAAGELEIPEIPTEAVYEAENWFKDSVIDPIYGGAVSFRDNIQMMITSIVPSLLAQVTPPSSVKQILAGLVPWGIAAQTIAWNIGEKERTPEQQLQYEKIQASALDRFLFYDYKIKTFQETHPELLAKPEYFENPFDKPALFLDPGYWAYSFSSSLTYTLATMSTIIVGSVVGTPAVGIPAGMTVAGGAESADMLTELMSMGVPFEDAVRWSGLYGLFAGGIEVASDLPFLGLIFKPVQVATKPLLNTIRKMFTNLILRRFAVGVALSFTEGIEEGLTQISHNAIIKYYDDTKSIWEGVSHAFIQGMIASAPFAGMGGHASFRTFRDTLSPKVRQQYDTYVEEFIKAGLTEQQAQIQAANQIARTDEGEAEIAKALEAAQQEYWEAQGKTPPAMIAEAYEGIDVLREIQVSQEVASKDKPQGIPMPGNVQAEFIDRARSWLQEVPDVQPSSVYTVPVADGEAFIRTDSKGDIAIAAVSLMREARLTLSTVVGVKQKGLGLGKAGLDLINYIESQNIALPPTIEMSPDAIRAYEKYLAMRAKKPTAPVSASQAESARILSEMGVVIPEGWTVSIFGRNPDGTFVLHVTPKEGESVVIQNFDVARPLVEQYQEALAIQQGILAEAVEKAKARPPKPYMPKAPPVTPKAAPGMPKAGLQPSMLAEVPAKEVRPETMGKLVQSKMDDYLKLNEYNAKAAVARIEEIKKLLQQPGRLAKDLGTKGNLRIELARLEAMREVDAVENVEELDHLIQQLGEELGLRSMPYAGYGGKAYIDLLRSPTHRLFKGYTGKQLEAMMEVYQQARQTLSPEVPATTVNKAQDIPLDIPVLRDVSLTPAQIEKTIDLFKEAVAAPSVEAQRAATLELRKHVLARRAKLASESAEAIIAEGAAPQEAIRIAKDQFMRGTLPDVGTEYFSDLTDEMRNVLFAKVWLYWHDKPLGFLEAISTFDALTNALAGRSIPRKPGTGTKYFPEGGSAWDRLARVFIGDMEVLRALDEGKSLRNIVEGIHVETGRGEVALNQETVDWLKTLAEISDEDRLLLENPIDQLTETQVRRIAQATLFEKKRQLDSLLQEGAITEQDYKLQLQLAKDKVFPYRPVAQPVHYPAQGFGVPRLGEEYQPLEALPEDRTARELELRKQAMEAEKGLAEAREKRPEEPFQPMLVSYPPGMFKELPLLTFREKGTIVRTLKNIGMSLVDIGNALRALKATLDLSYWRQTATLAAGHLPQFYKSNVDAWQAMWSQQATDAQQERMTRDPEFELYEDIRKETGHDPMRILVVPKGTERWRAAEEFGYLTGERPIPRFMAGLPIVKYPGRHFVSGINSLVWQIWKGELALARRDALKVASGENVLPEGEAFSIKKRMIEVQKYLADASQRGTLGKASALAPVLGATFFSPRSKLGRFLYPRHLISPDPRVRKLAWKDFVAWTGVRMAVIMLGWSLGWWDVERDPRNAEFMSIRIGNMRIDPWAGNRQFVVLYARLFTRTGLSSVTGQEYEVNPIAALTTFFRSSLAPLTSILLDFWTGRNFLGEELDIADPRQWLERIAPFAVQDVWEAWEEDWQKGVIAIVPAIFGEGVQTYTGDWRDNWAKVGMPKYPENLGYGLGEPVYDLADFWADTAGGFRGVDPADLTPSKGYPEYVRSIATALQIIEQISLLPNQRLVSINADPEEGTTFMQYYQMWQAREAIVASGDQEKLKEFDQDERTRKAYLGNITQAQYALLVEYHSLPETEKAEFLAKHPGIYLDPRDEWLRTQPEENGLLALWDKANIYSLDALSKMNALAKSLGIPESALLFEEFDAVTQLKIKHADLFELWDAYAGLDDEIEDAEGLTARDRARQEIELNNPDFVDDKRRIEALSQGTEDMPTLEEIVEAWVDRGRIIDEYGASSAEAKLWLIDNRESHQWALDHALLSDDGTDWNEPILRLIVQHGENFDLYGAYGDMTSDRYVDDDEQRRAARQRLLFDEDHNLTPFGEAYYTKQAASEGYSEAIWTDYVEYSGLPIWGSWRERFLLDNIAFYKEYVDPEIGAHPLVDEVDVKPLIRDNIYKQFYEQFRSWDETAAMSEIQIENMRAELDEMEKGGLTFLEARYMVDAYDIGFPEELIEDYLDWYSVSRKDYEDDWWLMEHVDFYRKMLELELWTKPRDFSKVPTREVWKLYQDYQMLPPGSARLNFRAKHLDLDHWLVTTKGYRPVEGRGSAEAPPSPWEEAYRESAIAEDILERYREGTLVS